MMPEWTATFATTFWDSFLHHERGCVCTRIKECIEAYWVGCLMDGCLVGLLEGWDAWTTGSDDAGWTEL
jgi:hypothetical protein